MSKIHAQDAETVLATTASLAVNGTVSGSMICAGYARLMGTVISNASTTAIGLVVQHSANQGANWDYTSGSYTIAACSGSGFDIPIYGNAVKVSASNGATAASLFRAFFWLRPV